MASSSLPVPEPPSIVPSPKRKRDAPLLPTSPQSSPPNAKILVKTSNLVSDDDETSASSPRTKVASNLQNLQIEDGVVSKLDLKLGGMAILEGRNKETDGLEDEGQARKRAKRVEIPETPDAHAVKKATAAATKSRDRAVEINTRFVETLMSDADDEKATLQGEVDPTMFKAGSPLGKLKGGGLRRAYPSINRLSESKSRARKRAGTPPLSSSTKLDSEEEAIIVDPERAAQTWHDDEITGHDPSDPEDDGEGINGIGFKPTAAEAHARVQKRKAQMAEYKSREAKEARARRIERRQASEKAEQDKAREDDKKVRFMEGENMSVETII
ncbi:hypothetical protein BJ875DRAFT_374426 [Amylocarpus encephaloides]|uniref:Uncharacterized protein n=1 Tax=Amylocarpus encephaloides TaxID=45428 RepID=A0A9P7YKT0_9HELO|nr:hypothetical protein BJ875DRAFT_374426 [Amylocarpus encephaloides]